MPRVDYDAKIVAAEKAIKHHEEQLEKAKEKLAMLIEKKELAESKELAKMLKASGKSLEEFKEWANN